MNILTKFSIGDTVFFMKENKVESKIVSQILLEVRTDQAPSTITPEGILFEEYYSFYKGNLACKSDKFPGYLLFGSKQELLDSL